MQAVRLTSPDLIIHLGDCWVDGQELHALFPDIPYEAVCGNCDCVRETEEKILLLEGHRVLICHGHTYRVKSGMLNLEYGAREKDVAVALFGHTHQGFTDWHNGVRLFNPGSIGAPPFGLRPSYGILTVDSREIHMEIASL